jgi:hypothetical protein
MALPIPSISCYIYYKLILCKENKLLTRKGAAI